MFRFLCHVLALCALLSFVFLFKVLWSAALASGADVRRWNAVCPGLKRRRTGAERKRKRGASDGVSGRDRGEKRVSKGSEWLECAPGLSEWAARWAGGYCVEAAGVRVSVTDTKNNISWQKTLWPSVEVSTTPLVPTGSLWILRDVSVFVTRALKETHFLSFLNNTVTNR